MTDRRFCGLVGALAVVLVLTACGKDSEPRETVTVTSTVVESSVVTGSTETTAAAAHAVIPYFLSAGQLATAAPVQVAGPAVGAPAVLEVLSGPDDDRLTSAVPAGTRFLGLTISSGLATVDLSREFESGGGSASMRARVAQIVFALTQFPTVRRVAFRIEGKPVRSIGGEGVVVDPPIGRAAFDDLAPLIFVERPGFGEQVRSPLRATGTANTFEATFQYELVGPGGKILAKDFVTASSGNGTRGTFSFEAPFSVDRSTDATLVVYENSAEDGSRIHTRKIPVLLEPAR